MQTVSRVIEPSKIIEISSKWRYLSRSSTRFVWLSLGLINIDANSATRSSPMCRLPCSAMIVTQLVHDRSTTKQASDASPSYAL